MGQFGTKKNGKIKKNAKNFVFSKINITFALTCSLKIAKKGCFVTRLLPISSTSELFILIIN
jgi:hypothetical protein